MELTDENIKRLKSLVRVGMDMNDKENWLNGEYFGNARKHWEGAMIGIESWVKLMRESQNASTSDEALSIGEVVGQIEQLKALLSKVVEEFDNGEVTWETRDAIEGELKSL